MKPCENCLGIGYMDEAMNVACDMCGQTGCVPDDKMRAIVVGRHMGEIPGIEIVFTQNITWVASREGCQLQMEELLLNASRIACVVILQNVPVQVCAALAHILADNRTKADSWNEDVVLFSTPVYGVVSVPVEAKDGELRRFEFHHLEPLLNAQMYS